MCCSSSVRVMCRPPGHPGDVIADRVGQADPALAGQPQYGGGDDGLGVAGDAEVVGQAHRRAGGQVGGPARGGPAAAALPDTRDRARRAVGGHRGGQRRVQPRPDPRAELAGPRWPGRHSGGRPRRRPGRDPGRGEHRPDEQAGGHGGGHGRRPGAAGGPGRAPGAGRAGCGEVIRHPITRPSAGSRRDGRPRRPRRPAVRGTGACHAPQHRDGGGQRFGDPARAAVGGADGRAAPWPVLWPTAWQSRSLGQVTAHSRARPGGDGLRRPGLAAVIGGRYRRGAGPDRSQARRAAVIVSHAGDPVQGEGAGEVGRGPGPARVGGPGRDSRWRR